MSAEPVLPDAVDRHRLDEARASTRLEKTSVGIVIATTIAKRTTTGIVVVTVTVTDRVVLSLGKNSAGYMFLILVD